MQKLITTQSFELSTIPKGINQNSDTGVKFAASGSAAASLVQNAFGVLPSGSTDNIRWEIGNVDNSTGNFSLLIRRGDDSTDNKVILEQYLNVNLDPFSPRYIEKVIGNTTLTVRSGSGAGNEYLQITGSYKNNSRYVFVSAVNRPTPNYLDAAGIVGGVTAGAYSASLPRVGSGSFIGATGTNFEGISYAGGPKYYSDISCMLPPRLANKRGCQGRLVGGKCSGRFTIR